MIKTTIDFPHLPDSGLLQFSSLTEFVGWLDLGDVYYDLLQAIQDAIFPTADSVA